MHRRRWMQAMAAAALGLRWPGAAAALDSDALRRAADDADLHSLMVWQRGALQLQYHRRSRDKPIGDWFQREVDFDADQLHDMRSISKSVIGLLAGQAVGRGELRIDQPVLDFFPELSPLRGGTHNALTVAHLLDMSCGLAWSETVTTYGTPANDETRLWFDAAPWRYILDRELQHPPGTVWAYNGGCTVLLAEILQRCGGKPWLDQAREQLFEPMGITRWEWRQGAHGQPVAYAGLRLSASDLLKLGRLMLDQGRWQGRQVVPAAWVETTLQPQIRFSGGPGGYSRHWWSGSVLRDGSELAVTAAFGNGGQRLYLVPALDLAVVFTAGQYNSARIGGTQRLLFQQIAATV